MRTFIHFIRKVLVELIELILKMLNLFLNSSIRLYLLSRHLLFFRLDSYERCGLILRNRDQLVHTVFLTHVSIYLRHLWSLKVRLTDVVFVSKMRSISVTDLRVYIRGIPRLLVLSRHYSLSKLLVFISVSDQIAMARWQKILRRQSSFIRLLL